jgi:hypothetical protein
MGQMVNGYEILVAKPEGKKPLGRSRRRWEYIVMEIGWGKCGLDASGSR